MAYFASKFPGLIGWRLRWWGRQTARAVMRHWQWFVLAGVLVPMGTPLPGLLRALAFPVMQALEPGHDVGWHVARLVPLHLLAVAWVLTQRGAIDGGPSRGYLRSLQLTPAQRRLVDLAVLLPANTVLLAPFVAGFALAAMRGTHGVDVAATAAVALLALLAQLAVLERRAPALLPILTADLLLAAALAAASPWVREPMLACAVAVGLGALARLPRLRRLGSIRPRRAVPRAAARPLPDVRIQVKALLAQPASLPRAAVLAGIVAGADMLNLAFGFDTRALPTSAIALAALALAMAGWHRVLRDAHRPVAAYLASLPLPPGFWPRRDVRLLVGVAAVPGAGVLLPVTGGAAGTAVPAALLFAGYGVLVAALRWPLLRGGRQATLLAALMAAAWSAAAVAATIH